MWSFDATVLAAADPSPAPGTGTSAAASVAVLSWNQTLIFVAIVAVAVLAVGAILVWARSAVPQATGGSVVRSWIALALVLGLVLFCAFSFAVDDATLRSTLIGGLTASVGAAVTFYFQAKSNKDLVDAAVGTETVPNLVGKSEADAQTALGKTSLKLEIDPAHGPQNAAAPVTDQAPAANAAVRKGTSVVVKF
jgi:hypothetical protein